MFVKPRNDLAFFSHLMVVQSEWDIPILCRVIDLSISTTNKNKKIKIAVFRVSSSSLSPNITRATKSQRQSTNDEKIKMETTINMTLNW